MNSSGPADRMACPHCGGLNGPDAQWCGRCLERFAPLPPSAPVAQTRARPAGAAPSSLPGPRHAAGFAVTDAGITWTCAVCESTNDLGASLCSACGSPLAETLRPAEPLAPQRDPGTAALASLLLPGAGHAYLGIWPEAVARAVISAWVVLVASMSVLSGSGGFMTLTAVVFGAAAFGLWGAAAHDAFCVAAGRPSLVVLRGRTFLYLVLALLFLLFVTLSASAMSLRAS